MEYQEPEKFVRNVLADRSSYILNGYSNDHFYQFEYKVEKSEAVRNLELHKNGLVEVPRWIVYFSIPVMIFLIALFTGALIAMGSVKPDAIYGQSCADRSCSKALNLKCINRLCQCESPKYYTNKCVDLSKYGEKCVSRDNCDPSQDMICFGSICSCAPTKYWNSESNKCVDRLTYGQTCYGDQCKIRINLECSSLGVCLCIDNTFAATIRGSGAKLTLKNNLEFFLSEKYYWDDTVKECVAKKRYSLCTDLQYYDGSQCHDRVGEFSTCAYDDMCLLPMFCSSSNCTCDIYYFFNATISNCQEQHFPEGVCSSNHHCREDKLLLCDAGTCKCPTGHSWSSTSQICKLTYSFGTCSQSSDCNSNEELACATNTNCNCPNTSTINHCDCYRDLTKEMYWDASTSKCVDALVFGGSCSDDYQCKTMIELTKCIDEKCDCEQVGGFASWNQCKKCEDGDYYYNDKCYFFSIASDTKSREDAKNNCDNLKFSKDLAFVEKVYQENNILKVNELKPKYVQGQKLIVPSEFQI
ncbi:prion-like-(Q N-rich) domain-bearing 25 [Brachionus plicatilis]|uniref:Prion-like-(Q N-rich) domain-bearing 25 n=1 Tax=Brachionus plicatilis TaxID=10195 RepID=A0A3M7RBR8_BRAPC|nr:prion-like-(Q N-rich) domain-bearing 25 [Brachionus plicatilis]